MKKQPDRTPGKPNEHKPKKDADLNTLIKWKVGSLFDLSRRLVICRKELIDRGVFPDEFTTHRILHDATDPAIQKFVAAVDHIYGKLPTLTELNSREEKQDRFDAVFRFVCDTIKNSTPPKDKDALVELATACELLSKSYDNKIVQGRNMVLFMGSEHLLRTIACETIGYWTAKLEVKKKNYSNAQTRTKLSGNNKTTIATLLEKYNIHDLGVFRKNKKLRKSFMDECRKETAKNDKDGYSLSDDRILKKARAVLKARGFNAVSTAKTPE